MFARLKRLTLLIALPLALVACSSDDDPTGPGGGGSSGSGELAKILDDAGAFQEFTASYEETEAEEFDGGNDQYFCTRKQVDLTQGYSNFSQFDPNSQVIFPGNLLQGNTLDNATPSSIPVDRGPGRVVMTLVNGNTAPVTRDLPEVGIGAVYDAMNSIIASSPSDLPARSTFNMERISSRQQLGVSIRAEYESVGTEIQGSFDYDSDVKYNRFLVKLTQSYYTIVFEQPTDTADFFGAGVTTQRLNQYVGPGNPAAYVSSVTYGRIFYLLIQSTDSVQEIDASVRASFDGAVSSGTIEGDVKYVSELSELKIGGYAIGGDSQLANTALLGNFEDLVTFVRDGGTITTGQPISYTVNAANDPAKQLKVKVATSYDIVDCTPIGSSLDNGVAWYRSDHGVSSRSWYGTRAVTRWADLLGNSENDATVPFGGPDVAAQYSGAVSFQYHAAEMTGYMRIPGQDLRNTDYTIFAVVQRLGLPPSDNTPVYWMWGESDDPGRGLRIGFPNANTISVSHGGDLDLSAPTLSSVAGRYQVFTIRFSQEEGMSIYVNGLLQAEDPSIRTPLELFSGARIGVADINGFSGGVGYGTTEMLDLQIYGIAATESQRLFVEDSLMSKYGI